MFAKVKQFFTRRKSAKKDKYQIAESVSFSWSASSELVLSVFFLYILYKKSSFINLHLINKFGILKERFSAMLTDSIRANILQYFGYKTQVMEFVDFEKGLDKELDDFLKHLLND